MGKISVVFVLQHRLVREYLSDMFINDEKIFIGGSFESIEYAGEILSNRKKHVVVIDYVPELLEKKSIFKSIKRQCPAAAILVLSSNANPVIGRKLLHDGAEGYITMNSLFNDLKNAILKIASGQRYLGFDTYSFPAIPQQFTSNRDPVNFEHLTTRELQIIRLIQQGLTSRQIASTLQIQLKTVEKHRHNILDKLNVVNTAAMISIVNIAGLI